MADLLGLGLIQIDPQRGAGWRAGEIRHAAAAAELAILLPFLAFAFVIAVDWSRIFYYSVIVTNCARNGALYASDPTTLLAYWARDRSPGLPLEWVVRRQCRVTAETVGLFDRGLLEPGLKADVNVVDHANLRLRPPYMAFDLPAGGKRLLQRAEGYLHTFVNGEEVYADGEPCGALPGRLVRGSGLLA